MSNIRQHLLPFERSCRFRFMQTLNCYNSVNIATRITSQCEKPGLAISTSAVIINFHIFDLIIYRKYFVLIVKKYN